MRNRVMYEKGILFSSVSGFELFSHTGALSICGTVEDEMVHFSDHESF